MTEYQPFNDGVSYTVKELLEMLSADLTQEDFKAVHLIKKHFQKKGGSVKDKQTRTYKPIQWEQHTCECGSVHFKIYHHPVPGTMRHRIICAQCQQFQGMIYTLQAKRLCKVSPLYSWKHSQIGEQMELAL